MGEKNKTKSSPKKASVKKPSNKETQTKTATKGKKAVKKSSVSNKESAEKKHGGARKGSGRPKGKVNKATLEKQKVEAEIKQRLLKNAHRITDRMLQLAEGCSFLYKIETDDKGRQKKAEIVTSEDEIRTYLEGGYDHGLDYYFITTEKPNFKALENMMDRVLGKPKQAMDLTSGGRSIGDILSGIKQQQK